MDSSRGVESGAAFVWMVWGPMVLALIAFVGRYGSNAPWGDDGFPLAVFYPNALGPCKLRITGIPPLRD